MFDKEELAYYIRAKQREITHLSKRSLLFNEKKFNHRVDYYRIKSHLDQFMEKEYYNRFIVMPGLRGVGKTTILYQIYQYLIESGVSNSDILYVDVGELKSFFDYSLFDLITVFLNNIHQTSIVNLDKKLYILVDEAHLDDNWANVGKYVFDRTKNIFMIFTGSSALDLELNVDAVRRVKKEQIFPCTFPEYLHLNYDMDYPCRMSGYLTDLILKGNSKSFALALEEENKINNNLSALNNDAEIEFRKFLFSYGFPYSIHLSEDEIHKKTVDTIDRIIMKDIPAIKHFKSNGNISRIITYLAMQKPGGISNKKLAQSLELSSKTVNEILDSLEKTQLIISLKPYGTGGKVLKKPWEYFFLSPSIKASINYEIGRYDIISDKCFAALAETMVMASLYKLKITGKNHLGLFYDGNKKGVDFLVHNVDRIIPVEVGIGKKTKSQLTKAIGEYGSDYGILVSNRTSEIKYENDIIYIPLMTFSYL